jgi:pyruvate/2-oxoglutarate dehydrogenase complex dihydrolipoamide acyltransferase (E2) component
VPYYAGKPMQANARRYEPGEVVDVTGWSLRAIHTLTSSGHLMHTTDPAVLGGTVAATEAAIHRANEKGVFLGTVEGSGTRGRITKADVEQAATP